MITLYDDQEKLVNEVRAAMRKYKSVLLQSSTGSGKTQMATYMIKSAIDKGNIAAFLVPRKQLLDQVSDTFSEQDITHSFVASGRQFNPYSRAYVCSIGTLVNRLDWIKPKIVFVDESHYGAAALDKIIKHYKLQGSWIIGLSATPMKPGGKGLNQWYDHMVTGLPISELIKLGRLSDYRLFCPNTLDLSGLKVSQGDYNKKELAGFMEEQRKLIGDIVGHYKKFAMGKLNITFATSVKHSNLLNESFNAAGVPSAHVDAETPDSERRQIARDFAMGKLLNICSVDLMTFGYDLASASGIKNVTIQSMSDARPTKSLPLQLQKWGRVLRRKEEDALIFDHANNFLEFGYPDDDREWTLEPVKKPKRKSNDDGQRIILKECPECFHKHPPAPQCPKCRYKYETKAREIDHEDGQLKEVSKEDRIKIAKREQAQAQSIEDLIKLGYQRGYKNPEAWAGYIYTARRKKK